MKATFALIADNYTDNLGKKLMLQAHQNTNCGFEASRLPSHISLKQPFKIDSLEATERFFDNLALSISPVNVDFTEVAVWPSNLFHGNASGVMVLKLEESILMRATHNSLNEQLEEQFGTVSAEFDGDSYQFHMTIAIGNASFEEYQNALPFMEKPPFPKPAHFNKLGLFYYDDDVITSGSYFCYKQISI